MNFGRKLHPSGMDARQDLEEKILQLEAKHANTNMPIPDAKVFDKSMIVSGGFASDALDDGE